MANEIQISFKIDGIQKEVSSVEELQKELDKAAKSAKDYSNNADDAADATKDLGKESKKTEKETGFLAETFGRIGETFTKLKADAKGVANGFVSFARGLGLSSKAAKGLAVGLSALGIPLLLVAISALIDYFSNFEGAAKLVQKALASAGAVIRKVTEGVMALLKGDWSGAKEAIKGIGEAAGDAAKEVDKLFDAQKRLRDLQNQNVIANAELRQSIEKNKKILEDSTLSYEERMEALKKINEDTEKLAQNEKAVTEAKLEELEAQLKIEKNYEKVQEIQAEIASTKADLIDKETELNNIRDDAAKKERELIQQREDEEKARTQKAIERRKEYYNQLSTLEQQNELARIEDAEERAKRRLEIERENAIKEIQNAEFTAEQKRKLIAQINESYDLQEEARLEKKRAKEALDELAANEKAADRERQAGMKLLQIENQIALLRADSAQERRDIQLQQQEAAEIAAAESVVRQLDIERDKAVKRLELNGASAAEIKELEDSFAEQRVAAVENEEELKEAIREKYRVQRKANELTDQKRIAELLKEAEPELEGQDPFEMARNELDAQEEKAKAELKLLGATEEEKQKLEKSFTKKREKLAQEEADFKKKLKQAEIAAALDASKQVLDSIVDTVGEGSAIGKAAAVASATIDTYKGATAAYANAQNVPVIGGVLAPIAAGIAVAAGLANVRKIIQTKTPGNGGGGAAGGVPSPAAASSVPAFDPTVALDAAAEGQTGAPTITPEQEGSQATTPIKAYVVATEVTSEQEANKKIEDLSKL